MVRHPHALRYAAAHQPLTSVGDARRVDDSLNNSWLLFNDFLVREVAQEEALSFSASWKARIALDYSPSKSSTE